MKNHFTSLSVTYLLIFSGLLFLFAVPPAIAVPYRVAILPFDMHAERDISFLQEGIIDMLSSRIVHQDQVEVITKSETRSALASVEGFEGESRALAIGDKLDADFVLFGSITMFGESVSIDANIVDMSGQNAPLPFYVQALGMSEVIPQINQFATRINVTVFGRAEPQRTKAYTSLSTDSAQTSLTQPTTAVDSRMQPKKLLQPASPFEKEGQPDGRPQSAQLPNPLLLAPPKVKSDSNESVFWRSKNLSAVISAMDIGDVDNDGALETIIAIDNAIEIYRTVKDRMQKIAEIKKIPKGIYIGIDVADINGNGIPEIFVASIAFQHDRFNSFVLEFDGTEFRTNVDRSPWLYRVSHPVRSAPILLGQRRKTANDEGDLFSSPIYKMSWNGSEYVPEQQMVKGRIANVMGTTVDDVMNDGVNRLLTYSPGDRLRIFNNDGKAVWKGREKHGGSITTFTIPTKDPSSIDNVQFFPMRLRTADINNDGKIEVIIASNHDVAGVMKNFRYYSKSSIISMCWNGLALSQDWSTEEIDGRIADYLIGDFDNDGINEIVAAVILVEKSMVGMKGKSVVIAYDLST